MKGNSFSFLSLNKFNFGGRLIYQFIIFEYKPLFSLLFFYFCKSDKKQDRFHTHAFNAISIKLFGSYNEYVLDDSKSVIVKERTEIVKYFPRDSYHLIGESKRGCLTMLISGPWKREWKEYVDGEEVSYSWNRKIVK
jgi:hypothetical protein